MFFKMRRITGINKITFFIGLFFLSLFIGVLAFNFKVLSKDRTQAITQATPLAKEAKPHPARFWERLENNKVQCHLCPNECILSVGERGRCRVRENQGGRLVTLVYGLPCAIHVDPIEKKPLFHVLPASRAFSIATAGCNLRCKFCQNWQIAQNPPEMTVNFDLPPKKIVQMAKEKNCPVIAFTYTEPTVFYEYMYDVAVEAKLAGIKTVMHSAGFINPEPLRQLCPYLDAANIDLKGFTDEYYRKMSQGRLDVVLRTLKILKEEGVHLEITNLIVPTKNDDPKTIRKMCRWIKENLGEDTPIHFSRFWPMYRLQNLPPTPIKTLEQARTIALSEGLQYVYIGNVPGHEAENTYCPKCHRLLIRRIGYHILENNIRDGRCKFCGYKIPGIWK